MSDDHTGTATGLAAFDFDGTLTPRDTLVPFLARLTSWPRLLGAAGATIARSRGRADRDRLKGDLIRLATAGRPRAEVEREAKAYAGTILPTLVPTMVERVVWHRARGHELVVVSASLRCYVEPVATALGFDDVLAVELETTPDGMLTGEMAGPNVRGPEKVARLEAWLDGRRPRLWAYGDSSGDHELLRRADHPVALTGRARRGL